MKAASFSHRVCHLFTLCMVTWPDAGRARNSTAASSAGGSTVRVLMRRLNPSCRGSAALALARALLRRSLVRLLCRRYHLVLPTGRNTYPVRATARPLHSSVPALSHPVGC